MNFNELIDRANGHVADYRAIHPGKPLPPELFTMECMIAAIEAQERLNVRSREVIHAAINDLTGLKPAGR